MQTRIVFSHMRDFVARTIEISHKHEIQTCPMGITAVQLGSTAVPMCNTHCT